MIEFFPLESYSWRSILDRTMFMIGNGFDITRNLPTNFEPDFSRIAESRESISVFWDLCQSRESNIWADFETNLAHLDLMT